jgi:tetratricopeptide (TPR) repeat protein
MSEWWESAAEGDSGLPETRAAAGLGARRAAFAVLTGHGDSVEVELKLYDEDGDQQPGPIMINALARPRDVSKAIAFALLTLELETVLHEGQRLPDDLSALQEYIWGQHNFERGRGEPAVEHYLASVAIDSTFALAWWGLANAWRWLGRPGPYEKNYQELFDRYASDLGVLDSMLMDAQLTPAGPERLRRYRATHERFPFEYFAAFLHGEELFNRGPLWGEPLERAVVELEEAVRLNPLWALAYVHLIWANIRLGHEEEARRYLDQLVEHAPDPDHSWTYPPQLLDQAISERFAPEEAGAARLQLLQGSGWGEPDSVALLARLAGAFDVPRTQVELGRALLAQGEVVPRPLQASAHLATGLGLVGLGRIGEALADFDMVAELLGTSEARLHAAEWRVLPHVVGLDVVDSAEVRRGREVLESLAGEDSVGVRACWALALDAYAVGDTIRARSLSSRAWAAPPESGARSLGEFLHAMREAGSGRHAAALERSERLLAVQTPTVLLSGSRPPGQLLSDPFARALLHLKRGEWHYAQDDEEAAEREYLWYEAVDVLGLPELGLPQAGEIDWALGNYGRLLRGLMTRDRERACGLLSHVLDAWSGADPRFAEEVALVQSAASQKCR